MRSELQETVIYYTENHGECTENHGAKGKVGSAKKLIRKMQSGKGKVGSA